MRNGYLQKQTNQKKAFVMLDLKVSDNTKYLQISDNFKLSNDI